MAHSESRPLLADNGNASSATQDRDAEEYMSTIKKTYLTPARRQIQRFLASKYGHYAVLLLVSLDVSCIFADFLISLNICDIKCTKGLEVSKGLPKAQNVLGIISLIFSCLFMAELIASLWAYGLRFFESWFRCFDAAIILAGFIIDVCLKGVLEEVGSVVVILRFWRVFKIVEEFSAGASDRMDELNEKLENLKVENRDLRKRLKVLSPGDSVG